MSGLSEPDPGTLAVVKILGPEYRLSQWPLIVPHSLVLFSSVPINSPADQGRQGQIGECGLEATRTWLSLLEVEAN